MPEVDEKEIKKLLAAIFVAAMVNREHHNPTPEKATLIAQNACDLVDQLDLQFKARGWSQ